MERDAATIGESDGDDSASPNDVTATPDQPDVVKDISERVCRLLECPVCMSLATRMACLCANGHVVCGSCLIRLNYQVPETSCPLCRSPIVSNAFTLATSFRLSLITSAMKVACPYRAYGCADLLRLDQVTLHESECAYMPTTRCLASTCRWVGNYGQLFEHVRGSHRHVGVTTTRNRLLIHDANSIASHRRRSYLVNSPIGMFWVLLFKETRNRFRVGVFSVREDPDVRSSVAQDKKNNMYRVVWSDVDGRRRNQSSTAVVQCSTSLKYWTQGIDGGRAHANTMIRRNTGCLEVHWYERHLRRSIPNDYSH